MPETGPGSIAADRRWLERLYRRYHHRRFVRPDPLEFLYLFDAPADREIAGLVASALAYGNVTAMRQAIAAVLELLGPAPAAELDRARPALLRRRLAGFRYRFTTGAQVAALLLAARAVRRRHGSLGACLGAHAAASHATVVPALGGLVDELRGEGDRALAHLLPRPADGSACKRLNLYLRWMIRRDRVDPGGWRTALPRQLVVPLDVHVQRAARARGWLTRRTPDLAAALEVTAALRRIAPDDPLRYDFALTRPGILRTGHPAAAPLEDAPSPAARRSRAGNKALTRSGGGRRGKAG